MRKYNSEKIWKICQWLVDPLGVFGAQIALKKLLPDSIDETEVTVDSGVGILAFSHSH